MNPNLKIVWSSFFIVEGKLPRNPLDVSFTSESLKEIFKQDFIPQPFKNKLSNGEYIEAFCKYRQAESIETIITKEQDVSAAERIKELLSQHGHVNVFDDYYNFGQRAFDEKQDRKSNPTPTSSLSKNEDEATLSHQQVHLQSTPEKNISTDDNPTDTPIVEVPQSASLKESEKHAVEEDTSEQKLNDFTKFVYGMCNIEETMDFNELKVKDENYDDGENDEDGEQSDDEYDEDNEVLETVECLESCVTYFLQKIEYFLKEEATEIIKNMKDMDDDTEQILKKQKDIRCFDKKIKIDDLNQKFIFDFEDHANIGYESITSIGKKYLKLYSKLYSKVRKYLPQIRDVKRQNEKKPAITGIEKGTHSEGDEQQKLVENSKNVDEENNVETIESKLRISLQFYKSCSKRECFMTQRSTPLYDYIHNVAKGLIGRPISSEEAATLTTADDESKIPAETDHAEGNTTWSFDPLKISAAKRKEDKTINDEAPNSSILPAQANVIPNIEDESRSQTNNIDDDSQHMFFQVLTASNDNDEFNSEK